jgi:hypothetical protein
VVPRAPSPAETLRECDADDARAGGEVQGRVAFGVAGVGETCGMVG